MRISLDIRTGNAVHGLGQGVNGVRGGHTGVIIHRLACYKQCLPIHHKFSRNKSEREKRVIIIIIAVVPGNECFNFAIWRILPKIAKLKTVKLKYRWTQCQCCSSHARLRPQIKNANSVQMAHSPIFGTVTHPLVSSLYCASLEDRSTIRSSISWHIL